MNHLLFGTYVLVGLLGLADLYLRDEHLGLSLCGLTWFTGLVLIIHRLLDLAPPPTCS